MKRPAPNNRPPAIPSSSQFRFILRALKHRNFRLFFGGQLVSLCGTWLTMAATSWVVYELASHGPGAEPSRVLGRVAFAAQIPLFFLAPIGGVLADRWNRHRLLVLTQSLAMLQSFALAFLALRGIITVAQIMVLSAFQGLVNAADIPVRQAFITEMLDDPADLSNAIALNSSMVQGTRIIGPAIAGVLIRLTGAGLCFLVDGISYLAVIAALLAMRVAAPLQPRTSRHPLQALKDGFKYSAASAPIRTVLLLIAAVSVFAASQMVLMPIFAAQVLHGGSEVFGALLGSMGVGALAGTLYLASRRTVLGIGRVIAVSCALLGAAMIAFAASRRLWLSVPLLMVVGGGLVTTIASCNTLLQTIVDDDKRGRVMSLFAVAFMGMTPFGSLLAGELAARIGAPGTVAIGGGALIVCAAVFFSRLPRLRPLIRPIYVKKGILPVVAQAVQATAAPE